MLIHLNFVAGCHNQTLGWPLGGSRAFAEAIARRYTDLGGELHYAHAWTRYLVNDDRAVGVRLADGSEYTAGTVISAADGHATIYDMLDGRYVNERINAYYATPPDRQDMNLHVSFGVARDMSSEPHALTMFLKEPVTLLGKERDRISVENYSFDPHMAPPGKTALKVLLDASYSHWKELQQDRAQIRRGQASAGRSGHRPAGAALPRHQGPGRGDRTWPRRSPSSATRASITACRPGWTKRAACWT